MYDYSLIKIFDNPTIHKPIPYNQYLLNLAEDIRRDLEDMLNTPHSYVFLPPTLPELIPSLVDYGIPYNLRSHLATESGRTTFCKKIKAIISLYETRLQNVEVSYKSEINKEDDQGIMSILIQGEVNLKPETEPIVYTAVINSLTQTFVINLGGG